MYDFAEDALKELEDRDREREELSKAIDDAPEDHLIQITSDMKGLHISVSPKEHHDLLVERIAKLKPTRPKLTEEERIQARKEKNKRFYNNHKEYFKEYSKQYRQKVQALTPEMKHQVRELERRKRYIITHNTEEGFVSHPFLV